MVAEEDDHSRLVTLAVIADQLPQGVVRLAGQGEILLGIAVGQLQAVGQGDGPLQIVPPLGIAAVILHGHVEEEGLHLLLGGLEDHLKVRCVGHIVADILGIHHVLLIHLVIKVQVVIGQGPVPAGGLIGVEGGGLIPLAPRQSRQGGHPLVHIQLIGHGVGRLEIGGEAGEILKLHAGRAPAGDGGVHPALNSILF